MNKSVLDYLENSAKKFPKKIAFSDALYEMTFEEVCEQAKHIGSFLCQKGMMQSPIIVRMEKGSRCIAAFFGCVYSGNCYVPVDISVPEKRLEQMIKLLDCKIILTDLCNEEFLNGVNFQGEVYYYEEIANSKIDNDRLNIIRRRMLDTDPLYIIFTSGSTGVPKGVTINHRSTIDFIDHFVDTFEITSEDVIANQAPFDFDVSVKDIYSTICVGATMHIVPKKLFILIPKLMEFFNEKKITTIIWAVSALTLISNMGGFKKTVPQYLKKIMFSGEVMPTKQLNIWRDNIPDAKYVNLYGPTEITCNCLYYVIDRKFHNEERIPLGQAFDNTEVFLLNDKNEIANTNELGEICVRGSSLSLGYYNNNEATRKAFVINPLNSHYPELIYRTGDLAQYNSQGELVYATRKDFQIKHMGHRIELGEIEFAINSIQEIEGNVCLYDKECSKIICIYQGRDIDAKYILYQLKPLLPKFMFPHIFIEMELLPLNKNSKIDRVLLQEHYYKNKETNV